MRGDFSAYSEFIVTLSLSPRIFKFTRKQKNSKGFFGSPMEIFQKDIGIKCKFDSVLEISSNGGEWSDLEEKKFRVIARFIPSAFGLFYPVTTFYPLSTLF